MVLILKISYSGKIAPVAGAILPSYIIHFYLKVINTNYAKYVNTLHNHPYLWHFIFLLQKVASIQWFQICK